MPIKAGTGRVLIAISDCCDFVSALCTLEGCLLSDNFSFASISLISFFIFSSVINCISSSAHLDSVNSKPVSCCLRGFLRGESSTVGLMVILDCSSSSSRPGEDVADTVVEPELWHPPPSWSPFGEHGGLDIDLLDDGRDVKTGTRFLAAPKSMWNKRKN